MTMSKIFAAWMYFGLVGAFLFILIQLVLIVDFVHGLAERWVDYYEETDSKKVYAGWFFHFFFSSRSQCWAAQFSYFQLWQLNLIDCRAIFLCWLFISSSACVHIPDLRSGSGWNHRHVHHLRKGKA